MRLIDADALDFGFPVTDDAYGLSRQIGIELVRERINAAPTIEQPTWISCAERLPTEDGKYLTYRIDEVRWGEFTSRMSCLSIEFYSVDFDGWWNDGVKLDDVTHWMHLPMPPKGDE